MSLLHYLIINFQIYSSWKCSWLPFRFKPQNKKRWQFMLLPRKSRLSVIKKSSVDYWPIKVVVQDVNFNLTLLTPLIKHLIWTPHKRFLLLQVRSSKSCSLQEKLRSSKRFSATRILRIVFEVLSCFCRCSNREKCSPKLILFKFAIQGKHTLLLVH